jgi:apolipoprotein N-acyltransferase
MKTKAERMAFIQEEKRQIVKPSLYRSLLYGFSIQLAVANRDMYWPLFLLFVSLVWIARIHSQEVEHDMALSTEPVMKKIIQSQYVTDFLFLILMGFFFPILIVFELPFFLSFAVYVVFAIALLVSDMLLERNGKRLDVEHPTKKELRTHPKSWKKI